MCSSGITVEPQGTHNALIPRIPNPFFTGQAVAVAGSYAPYSRVHSRTNTDGTATRREALCSILPAQRTFEHADIVSILVRSRIY